MASPKSTKTNIPKKGVISRVNSDARAPRVPRAVASAAGVRRGGGCSSEGCARAARPALGRWAGRLRARDRALGRGGCGPLEAGSGPRPQLPPGAPPTSSPPGGGGGRRASGAAAGHEGAGRARTSRPGAPTPAAGSGGLGGMFSREERGRGAPRVWGARGSLRTRARQGGEQRRRAGPGTRGSRSRQSPRASP